MHRGHVGDRGDSGDRLPGSAAMGRTSRGPVPPARCPRGPVHVYPILGAAGSLSDSAGGSCPCLYPPCRLRPQNGDPHAPTPDTLFQNSLAALFWPQTICSQRGSPASSLPGAWGRPWSPPRPVYQAAPPLPQRAAGTPLGHSVKPSAASAASLRAEAARRAEMCQCSYQQKATSASLPPTMVGHSACPLLPLAADNSSLYYIFSLN